MILCKSRGIHIVGSTRVGYKLVSKFKDEVNDNGILLFSVFSKYFSILLEQGINYSDEMF